MWQTGVFRLGRGVSARGGLTGFSNHRHHLGEVEAMEITKETLLREAQAQYGNDRGPFQQEASDGQEHGLRPGDGWPPGRVL
jgi:hypothetical protein